MNVLVRGEEVSRILLAPTQVGLDIIQAWEEQTFDAKPSVDIFDPLAATVWTVTRTKEAGKTHYLLAVDFKSSPIVTGDNAEGRIARILKSGANLDIRFRLPTLQEQKDAWANR